MKCGARDEIRHEVRALEENLHVEQRRSVEASLSEVHDWLKQALATKVVGNNYAARTNRDRS
jgi:ribosomal protein S20